MKKSFQIIVISAVCLGFIAFLGMSYWFGVKDRAVAQDFSGENQFVCEEPIPIGEAVNVATDFLNQIYKVYQGEQMTTAKNQINGLVGAIDNGGKVCDFNRCEASVATAGPTVKLCGQVGLGVGEKCYKRTIGSCAINDCVANKDGDVCPNLSGYLQGSGALDALANRLDANAQEIHNLFETKNKEVPAGLEKEGQQVSDEELVRIYLNAIEKDWLTPSPLKNTCALSELDRKRIEQGLMGDKYPLQCLEALSRDMYTPKPWSETCEKECETFSQECKNCLAKCEGNSVYAQLNCKIYSTGRGNEAAPPPEPANVCFQCGQSGLFDRCQEEECDLVYCTFEPGPISGTCKPSGTPMPTECSQCKTKICCEAMGAKCAFGNQSARVESVCYENVDPNKEIKVGENKKCALLPKQSKQCCGNLCSDGLNVACKQCLCEGLTQDECLDWICGGSRSNWVCCHEEPIKSPQWYAIDDKTEPNAIGLTKTGEYINGYPLQTKISTYVDNINKTSSGATVQRGVMASATGTPDGVMDLPFGTCVVVNDVGKEENKQGQEIIGQYDNNIFNFAQKYILFTPTQQYYCITDRGGEHIQSGERFDLWLDKTASYYEQYSVSGPSKDLGLQWGVRNSTIELWYDPANPCVKKGKVNLEVCKKTPPTKEEVAAGIDIKDFIYLKLGLGKEKQWNDASGPLKELLKCIDEKMTENFVVTSISDSAGINYCGDIKKFNDTDCGHTSANSCHYGGKQNKKYKEWEVALGGLHNLKSLAADISMKNSGGEAAAKAAACCGSSGNYQVTSIKEKDHYHISVAVKGNEIGKLNSVNDKDYYDCDKDFRENPGPGNSVISCPK